ncbi:MAG: hypothetical protein L6R40_004455 [Gallowayella cf. fulva]|nr:MAG: hypothetical protein L6R40_004455 [Xanthomendoza cf. fulva]
MRLLTPTRLLASISIFAPLSVCAPPNPPNLALQQGPAPIHQPVCLDQPGGYDLFVCARLLASLKNLPYFPYTIIWSEYATGDGRLPAVFYLSDTARKRQCFLTLDLYEPGVPLTAKERFSLKEELHEFNNVYFECLKKKQVGGLNRIGLLGNVAAWLGPRLDRIGALPANAKSMSGNETEVRKVRMINMAPFEDS